MVRFITNTLFFLHFIALLANGQQCYAQKPNAQAYIKDHKVLAGILAETYGIPYSVILAVAIVESSAGTSDIAKVLNNHFGIVGKNEFENSRGNKSRYRQYDNEIASYIDFCIYISNKKFYHKLKGKTDTKLWIRAISHCGYSEAPEAWVQKITHTIKANHLQ